MKANILIVDDDAEIRELLVQILQRAGFQVHQAKDGAALKEPMGRIQPDVVLLDYKLPDATGLDLLPIIKKEWPEAEVIMLTGHATYDVAVEATKRGAFHFQEKPFDPESLLNLIKRALEIRSLREAVSMNGNAIFQCEAMKAVVRTVRRVAAERCFHPHHRRERHGQGSDRCAAAMKFARDVGDGQHVRQHDAEEPRIVMHARGDVRRRKAAWPSSSSRRRSRRR